MKTMMPAFKHHRLLNEKLLLLTFICCFFMVLPGHSTDYYSFASTNDPNSINLTLRNSNGQLLNWRSRSNGTGDRPNYGSISSADKFIIQSGHTVITSEAASLPLSAIDISGRLVVQHTVNTSAADIKVLNTGAIEVAAGGQLQGSGSVIINGALLTALPDGFSGAATTALADTYSGITLGGNSVVSFNCNCNQTLTARSDYRNVKVEGSGVKTLGGDVQIRTNSNLTVEAGAVLSASANNYQVTFDDNSTAIINGTMQTADADGLYGGAGSTFIRKTSLSSFSLQYGPSGTVEYNGAGAQAITPLQYHNLTFSNGATPVYASAETLTITGDLTAGSAVELPGTVVFGGDNSQQIAGITFSKVLCSGSGSKTFTGDALIISELKLTAGKVYTNGHTLEIGPDGSLIEENDALVEGNVKVTRLLYDNLTQDFGGIGLFITPALAPGPTTVIRSTAADYIIGANGNKSIRRSYDIQASNVPANMDALLVIKYENTPEELNGADESQLEMFRSADGGNSWTRMGGTVSTATETVSLSGVNGFSIYTLGQYMLPPTLPVELQQFAAARNGNDAVLHWQTAMERENTGFGVEVSEDAVNYRQLAFVKSRNGNSKTEQEYSYTDSENGKTGVRYYRLRQTDTSGKTTYYGPRAVLFSRRGNSFAAFPTLFHDSFSLSFNTEKQEPLTLTLTDLGGRTVFRQQIAAAMGGSAYTITPPAHLPAGVYVLTVSTPNKSQAVRLVKQ